MNNLFRIEKELMMKIFFRIAAVITFILFVACNAFAGAATWGVAKSPDGEPIAYSVKGKGDITLVFVHGWSCDSRYWREQVPFFAKNYRVVTVDLAGHGHSGLGREIYTMQAFGNDVKAVVEKVGAKRVILIGSAADARKCHRYHRH
jgi:pimeloyl-ACP methyl ester carboxylesterase